MIAIAIATMPIITIGAGLFFFEGSIFLIFIIPSYETNFKPFH